ncbi:MAG: polyprenyl diphosphate synthase [Candidatus Bathyarchaeia archaeon]
MLRSLLAATGIERAREWWLERQIRRGGSFPEHVGFILDGNRRWAGSNGLPSWLGHRKGAAKAEELLTWCLELGIKTVSLYVFSIENFERPQEEVKEVLKLCEEKLNVVMRDKRIHEHKVRIKAIGRVDLLPETLRELIARVEKETAGYDKHWLNVAIAYTGRREIVDAARAISEEVLKGTLRPEEVDEKVVQQHLYTWHLPNPEPDLIIRTSGEERLSGFLLWQSAYSELYFPDIYWPDFHRLDLLKAIRTYQRRVRRFGK